MIWKLRGHENLQQKSHLSCCNVDFPENTVEDAALPFPAFRSERASHHYCCCQYSPVVSIYCLLFHTQNIHMKSSMSDILNPPNVQLHENLDITDFTKQTCMHIIYRKNPCRLNTTVFMYGSTELQPNTLTFCHGEKITVNCRHSDKSQTLGMNN